MNGRFLSAGVFMALMLSSLLAGHHGYCCAKEAIAADLNQALVRTLEEKRDNFVSQDTIRAYRCLRETAKGKVLFAVADERFCRNLIDGRLRKKAFIAFDAADGHCLNGMQEAGVIAGDTMLVSDKATGDTLAVKGMSVFRLPPCSACPTSVCRLLLRCLPWHGCSVRGLSCTDGEQKCWRIRPSMAESIILLKIAVSATLATCLSALPRCSSGFC